MKGTQMAGERAATRAPWKVGKWVAKKDSWWDRKKAGKSAAAKAVQRAGQKEPLWGWWKAGLRAKPWANRRAEPMESCWVEPKDTCLALQRAATMVWKWAGQTAEHWAVPWDSQWAAQKVGTKDETWVAS